MNEEFRVVSFVYNISFSEAAHDEIVEIYSPLSENLAVGPSWIDDGQFMGLFATKYISEGDVLCSYTGRTLSTLEALKLADKSYLMRLGTQTYVDAKNDLKCLARYINDCRNPAGYNVKFDKRPEKHDALVIATRDILVGEEIFADYGRWYWLGLKPSRLSLTALFKNRGIK